jgi:ribosomal protein S18 acetylase RimI-like enzyme
MEFFIRPAGPVDAEEIARTQRLSWQDAYRGILTPDTLAKAAEAWGAAHWQRALERTDDRSISLVLESRATGIVGFGVAGPRRQGRDPLLAPYKGEIYLLYLQPEFQRHGYGARLMAGMARVLRARGVDAAVVWALAANAAAIGFYEHLAGELVTQCRRPFFGETVSEVALGWRDIGRLANLTPRLRR